jgi:hypothetical protein
MNFEKYEVDIEQPKYPKKPFISKNPTVEQARKYADDFEIYNKQLAEYRKEQNRYNDRANELRELFFNDAFEELGIDKDHPKSDILKKMAWEHGPSSGYYEVFYWLEELSQLL